jgi:hypothetical protein
MYGYFFASTDVFLNADNIFPFLFALFAFFLALVNVISLHNCN